jgi:hypothetical protein
VVNGVPRKAYAHNVQPAAFEADIAEIIAELETQAEL